MQFFYFTPKQVTTPPEEIAYAFADQPHTAITVSNNGPSGGGGTLLTAQSDGFKVRIGDRDKHEWRKFPKHDAWLGWMRDDPPKPEELQRQAMLDGHFVELSDGNQWKIPVARRLVGENGDMRYVSALPFKYQLDENGEWTVGNVLDRHSRLWQIASESVDMWALASDNEIQLTVSDVCEYCCEVLSVNYRLSRFEVGCLGLLNETANAEIMAALLDLPTLSKKKKASGTLSTQPGETEEIQDTGQPTLIS